MAWFRRSQEILRADILIGPGAEHSVKLELSGEGKSFDRMKLFRTFYVTFLARLLYDAGPGPKAEQVLSSTRALLDGLTGKETAERAAAETDSLSEYRRVLLVDDVARPIERHRAIMVRQRDNSVVCNLRSYSGNKDLLLETGVLATIKCAEKSLGPKVYKDFSDALHRMCRFYRDIPYWQKEGLIAVPCMTLGILRK